MPLPAQSPDPSASRKDDGAYCDPKRRVLVRRLAGLPHQLAVYEHREKQRRPAVRLPRVVSAALDHNLAGPEPCFRTLEDERYITLQQADHDQSVRING